MFVGYARVSTLDQNPDMQEQALERHGCEKIFTEKASGGDNERAVLQETLSYLRPGDTLVVWRLDRLGRSLKKLIDLVNDLKERQVSFKSIEESIDTTSSTGQFFFHITGAFAELERNLIRERTMAGIVNARARGRNGGRPKAIDDETFNMALTLYEEKRTTVGQICDKLDISKRSFYRYLKNHKENQTPCSDCAV